jgi:hypothetical protein
VWVRVVVVVGAGTATDEKSAIPNRFSGDDLPCEFGFMLPCHRLVWREGDKRLHLVAVFPNFWKVRGRWHGRLHVWRLLHFVHQSLTIREKLERLKHS